MSGLDAVLPNRSVIADTISRWHWGETPRRIVRVIVSDEGGQRLARVYGDRGRDVEVLERLNVTGLVPAHRGWTLTLDDGRSIEASFEGCSSCSTPSALKRLDAMRAPA